ncbi:Protein CBR-PTD-2 [Caenorhabditis briggsae]|uniref:Protein CBR-PTD-2 n=1 Tax=Caenorhabditis briggsae TaxID=6238 RepID=A8XV57_CAEBR|nr:Protein CBR-PTD-2 [Caenorhabditis briggsae]CAP36524.2 Protein CBR-PTD-2 [Caenorhabditis briggsae]
MTTTVSKLVERIFMKYAHVVIDHPIIVIVLTGSVSVFLTCWSLYFNFGVIDLDPTKVGQDLTRRRREISNTTTLEPITVNYDDYGVDSEPNVSDLEDPCEMYASIGKGLPYDMIEYLGKVMIRVSSYDDVSQNRQKFFLFTVDVMRHLCKVDDVVDTLIAEFNFTNPAKSLKHSLNIPLYTTCPNMTTKNSCDGLNQEDISNFRDLLKKCNLDPKLDLCSAFSINHVNHWLLPSNNNSELIVTVVLKMAMWNGVDDREVYDSLIERLELHLEKNPYTRMAGVAMNMKNRVFQETIRVDSVIAGLSAFLVFLCFLVYSRSLIFTSIILMVVSLSAGVAFFVYTVILGIDFFPFINLLVVVILISIGADDAFLLLVYYRREVKKMSNLEYKIGSIYIPLYRESDLLSRSLRLSLHHSLVSMFVTSLTTATTFLTNLFSPVIVLRCFGIYAAITVLINYILVILILPGAIILTRPVRKQKPSPEVVDTVEPVELEKPKLENFNSKITEFTYYFRFGVVILSFILTGLSAFIIFQNPGLTIPQNNPTKLLIDSNIHEFFDNHMHRFNFQWQRSAKLVKNFVFGVEAIKLEKERKSGKKSLYHFRESSTLSPYHKPGKNFSDANFQLDVDKLDFYRRLVDSEAEKYRLENYTHFSWADKTLRLNESCLSENKTIPNNCILASSVRFKNLIHQFPDDFAVIPGDGPFIDHDLNVVGYFISIPSNQKLRVDTEVIGEFFKEIEQSCKIIKNTTSDPVLCLSSTEISRFYDIVSQLRSSSFVSVTISLGICLIVIVVCTRVINLSILSSMVIFFVILWTVASLIMLGWKLSVVESTILIITIGLSFDYTLHYVVAIRDAKFVSASEKVSSAHSTAGVACAFGSLTLFLAGLPLLFTQTASFYQVCVVHYFKNRALCCRIQIGTMLVILGITSLFGASIVLPAFLMAFSCDGGRQSTKL